MSRSSDHKARQRKKRQQQKQQAIRMHSGSPYRQAARTGELVACYVNEGWKEDGLATIFVLRRTTAQGLVMAAFFVDIWCAGLKDAWGWLNATMDEFRDRILQPPGGRPYNLKRVDLAVARRLVAGGIRFAERNGFRLPPRLQRWTAMLGDLGAINEADLSDFGVDGKLRWMGSEADLRRRLVGCSVRDFVQRNDVECLFSMDDFLQEEGDDEDEDDDDEQFVREVAERTSAALAQAVRRWCFATGQPPQPRLEEAAEFFFQLLLALRESPDDEPPPDMEDDAITPDEAAETDDLFEQVLSIYEDEQQRREVRAAISQVRDFLSEYDDPEELFASLDLGDLPEDGERSDRRDRV